MNRPLSMNAYYGLELLARDLVERRRAEADHDWLVRQAQLSGGVPKGGLCAALLPLRWRMPLWRAHATVLCARDTVA